MLNMREKWQILCSIFRTINTIYVPRILPIEWKLLIRNCGPNFVEVNNTLSNTITQTKLCKHKKEHFIPI